MEPLFSVLIANYNNADYLAQALDSVLNQTYTNWECLIIDDASTDYSKEIYDKYLVDNRIRVLYNAENKGCTYTKWRCIEESTGELCGFLDADDVLLPAALEVMVEAHKNNEVSIVSSRYYSCDNNSFNSTQNNSWGGVDS